MPENAYRLPSIMSWRVGRKRLCPILQGTSLRSFVNMSASDTPRLKSEYISNIHTAQAADAPMHRILPSRSDMSGFKPRREQAGPEPLQRQQRREVHHLHQQLTPASPKSYNCGMGDAHMQTCQLEMLPPLESFHQNQQSLRAQQCYDPSPSYESSLDSNNGKPMEPPSLYVGNLHLSVNEVELRTIFSDLGFVEDVKLLRDKLTSRSCGFGFVQYKEPRVAAVALPAKNGLVVRGQKIHVNWANEWDNRSATSNHFHVFVGDLAAEVDDDMLSEAVRPLGDCSNVRVVWDSVRNRNKGYGFLSFFTQEAAENAIYRMTGRYVGSRAVTLNWARHKRDSMQPVDVDTVHQADPTNANVYIGSISPDVSDSRLEAELSQFGVLLTMRIFRHKCFAFAQYQHHFDAVNAIVGLHRRQMGGKMLLLSWGRYQARAAAAVIGAFAPLTVTVPSTAVGDRLAPRMRGFHEGPDNGDTHGLHFPRPYSATSMGGRLIRQQQEMQQQIREHQLQQQQQQTQQQQPLPDQQQQQQPLPDQQQQQQQLLMQVLLPVEQGAHGRRARGGTPFYGGEEPCREVPEYLLPMEGSPQQLQMLLDAGASISGPSRASRPIPATSDIDVSALGIGISGMSLTVESWQTRSLRGLPSPVQQSLPHIRLTGLQGHDVFRQYYQHEQAATELGSYPFTGQVSDPHDTTVHSSNALGSNVTEALNASGFVTRPARHI